MSVLHARCGDGHPSPSPPRAPQGEAAVPGFPSQVPTTHIRIVTADHLPVGHLVAEAVGGLIGVHGHVQHVGGMHRQDGVSELGPAGTQQC